MKVRVSSTASLITTATGSLAMMRNSQAPRRRTLRTTTGSLSKRHCSITAVRARSISSLCSRVCSTNPLAKRPAFLEALLFSQNLSWERGSAACPISV